MSQDETVRAFIAVDLPEPARRAAAEVLRALQALPRADAVRWVRPELLHVTLRFLGNVETQRLGPLVERVGAELAELSPFALELGGVQVFPPRRPRVVALHVHPEETLGALAAATERGAVAAGFPAEERPFRAHLTLGRVRGRRGPAAAGVASPSPPTSWDVAEAVLFRSRLGSGGPRYTPLERIPLGKGAKRPRSEPQASEDRKGPGKGAKRPRSEPQASEDRKGPGKGAKRPRSEPQASEDRKGPGKGAKRPRSEPQASEDRTGFHPN